MTWRGAVGEKMACGRVGRRRAYDAALDEKLFVEEVSSFFCRHRGLRSSDLVSAQRVTVCGVLTARSHLDRQTVVQGNRTPPKVHPASNSSIKYENRGHDIQNAN